MRKHIGTKVVSMLVILLAIFIVNAILTGLGTERSVGAMKRLSENYMQMQQQSVVLTQAVSDEKLFANLIVMMDDKETATNIANSVADTNTTIDTAIEGIRTLSAAEGNAELTAALEAYDAEVGNLQKMVSDIADAYLAGDMDAALAVSQKIYAEIVLVQEKMDAFAETLNASATGLYQDRVQNVSSLDTFSGALFFVYVGVMALATFIIIQSISRPAKNASNHLGNIITKIEQNEGDLTERRRFNRTY